MFIRHQPVFQATAKLAPIRPPITNFKGGPVLGGSVKQTHLLKSSTVSMITIPIELVEQAEAELKKLFDSGVNIFAFTSNDPDFIKKHGGVRVSGFYTDLVMPADLE